MSRVQSIERAFAVLSALSDGPIGVTEVAERADLPKSTAARMLSSLEPRGRRRAGPGRHPLPPGPADRDARRGRRAGPEPHRDGPADPRGARGRDRRDGRPLDRRGLRRPLRRPGRARATRSRSATGPGRASRCTRCRRGSCSSPQLPSSTLDAYLSRDLESFTPRTITSPDALRERLAQVRDRRLRLGPRGVRRGPELRGRGRRRRHRRPRRGRPRPRPGVPLPAGPRDRSSASRSSPRRRAPPSDSAEAPEPPVLARWGDPNGPGTSPDPSGRNAVAG